MPPPARIDGDAVLHDQGADGDVGAQRPVIAEMHDRAAIDAARLRLELVDDLHGADLRRAGDRAAGKARRHADRAHRVRASVAAHDGDEMMHGGVAFEPAEHRHLTPCPAAQTREKSFRIRSTIMMFSARSFSLAESSSAEPRVRRAGRAERRACP